MTPIVSGNGGGGLFRSPALPVLFHLSADPLVTPHARSNSAVRLAASAGAHGRPRQVAGAPAINRLSSPW